MQQHTCRSACASPCAHFASTSCLKRVESIAYCTALVMLDRLGSGVVMANADGTSVFKAKTSRALAQNLVEREWVQHAVRNRISVQMEQVRRSSTSYTRINHAHVETVCDSCA